MKASLDKPFEGKRDIKFDSRKGAKRSRHGKNRAGKGIEADTDKVEEEKIEEKVEEEGV